LSDADISEEPARVLFEPSIQASRPDEPNELRVAMANTPDTPMPLKVAHTPLLVAKQVPCRLLPPVVPATPPHLFCRQADWRSGWAAAPARPRVRAMEEDISDARADRERRALAPWLTPVDARQQCPALFLSHRA
jgi:hypothetical protein